MPIEVEVEGLGVLEFPDDTPQDVISASVRKMAGGNEREQGIRSRMKAQGVPDDRIESGLKFDAEMDAARDRALPGALALGGGFFGGPAGAGLGAYVGSRATGESVGDSAVTGALNAVVPAAVSKGMSALGGFVKNKAVPMVSAAVKPSVALLRRRAGIEGTTPSAVGKRIADTILKEGLKTSDDAHALVGGLDKEVQAAVSGASDKKLDIASRIPRYLGALTRKVENQITPGRDRTAIQNFGRELMTDSPLSARTGEAAVADPSLETSLMRILNEARNMGKPALRATGTTGPSASFGSGSPRALRADVTPAEGLKIARAKSFFDKDASGASVAAGKATERALRDSVKQAVPEAAPLLRRQGQALDAAKVLEDMAVRTGNRDAMSLPGIVGAAPSLAQGKVPLLGMLSQFMRNNQMKVGHAAYKYGPKMQRGAAPTGEAVRAALMALMTNDE
jgi:hypothetical protein